MVNMTLTFVGPVLLSTHAVSTWAYYVFIFTKVLAISLARVITVSFRAWSTTAATTFRRHMWSPQPSTTRTTGFLTAITALMAFSIISTEQSDNKSDFLWIYWSWKDENFWNIKKRICHAAISFSISVCSSQLSETGSWKMSSSAWKRFASEANSSRHLTAIAVWFSKIWPIW